MKKLVALTLTLIFIFQPVAVQAIEAYQTWTPGEYWMMPTQQAYEAMAFIAMPEIDSPQDLFIDANNYLYVADSSRRHIVVLDGDRNFVRTIGNGELSSPTGVAVNAYGEIFVADADYVVQFSATGEVLNRFGRPDSFLFGATAPFRPLKLALDARGTIYVVGEAASNGLIRLSPDGEFLGYFGANDANLTLFQALQNIFTPRERRQFLNIPIPPTNVAVDSRGAIFTVTQGLENEGIKRFNVAGNNMMEDMFGFWAIDIAMAHHGGFFILNSDGWIIEFDSEGSVLFLFAGVDPTVQRLGVFRQPTSIVQDHSGNLLVSDALSGLIHVFTPTEFTRWVHLAMEYFEHGQYVQSMAYWEEVLRLHAAFPLAHYAIGQAMFLQEEFHQARQRFYLAGDRTGYSEAFWEIRSIWLQENSLLIVIGIVVFIALSQVWKFARKRGLRLPTPKSQIFRELGHVRKILVNPADAYYEIRFHGKASVKSATVLYIALVASFFIAIIATAYIFRWQLWFSIPIMMLIFVLAIALFVVVNFLIAAINEGEGSFRNVYIGTAYAATPFILLAMPITLLSHVLTFSEEFVYQFLFYVAVGWSLVLQFIMIKEIHDYEMRDVIKNILLTLFTGTVIVLVVFVQYLLLQQVWEFLQAFVMEVGTRG